MSINRSTNSAYPFDSETELGDIQQLKKALLKHKEELEENKQIQKDIISEKKVSLKLKAQEELQHYDKEMHKTLWLYDYLPMRVAAFTTLLFSGKQKLETSKENLKAIQNKLDGIYKENELLNQSEKEIETAYSVVNKQLMEVTNKENALLKKKFEFENPACHFQPKNQTNKQKPIIEETEEIVADSTIFKPKK